MNLARVRLVLWGLVLIVGIAATILMIYRQTLPDSDRVRIGGNFEMVTTKGESFNQNDLKGEPTMLFFGYTFCPDVCPTTLYESNVWRQALDLTGKDIKTVFVTVDPERDTPEQLDAYLSSFGDDIIGLTGTNEQVDNIKSKFGIFSEKAVDEDSSDYLVNHTATLFLLDENGQFAGTIAYGEGKESAVAKLRRLLNIEG
ncbi:SCO family protein [Maritalea mediterranea]|uniref:SCO family protein n=1 Tax=Maritalea mediterranea TaxID=2909667 RepID=A0ABS9E4T8_9HYPH|nr:SCO family protein [Maritalea mediterranea]MCF4097881.1 SCO family protein [Maritalea mediterranea]